MGENMRKGVCVAAFSAVLSVAWLVAGTTPSSAHIAGCRSDPTVTLSNGVQVTLYEDISDASTDVTHITYQLHIPKGLTAQSIVYTGDVPSSLQSVTTYADENAGNYDGYTVVTTGTPNISVTAYASATSGGTTVVSTHTSGHSGQTLHSHLHLS